MINGFAPTMMSAAGPAATTRPPALQRDQYLSALRSDMQDNGMLDGSIFGNSSSAGSVAGSGFGAPAGSTSGLGATAGSTAGTAGYRPPIQPSGQNPVEQLLPLIMNLFTMLIEMLGQGGGTQPGYRPEPTPPRPRPPIYSVAGSAGSAGNAGSTSSTNPNTSTTNRQAAISDDDL